MSENKHTPEPWQVFEDDPRAIVTKENPMLSLLSVGEDGLAIMYEEADARRIVACVNACEGIPTYQLTGEDGNPVILGDMIDLLRNQRDTLLPICEELRESAEYWSEYDVPLGIVERLTVAIASVKGGAV